MLLNLQVTPNLTACQAKLTWAGPAVRLCTGIGTHNTHMKSRRKQ